jgi:hypothetical protein
VFRTDQKLIRSIIPYVTLFRVNKNDTHKRYLLLIPFIYGGLHKNDYGHILLQICMSTHLKAHPFHTIHILFPWALNYLTVWVLTILHRPFPLILEAQIIFSVRYDTIIFTRRTFYSEHIVHKENIINVWNYLQ